MQMRLLSTRKKPNEVAKHTNNTNESLSKRMMANEVTKQKHNDK